MRGKSLSRGNALCGGMSVAAARRRAVAPLSFEIEEMNIWKSGTKALSTLGEFHAKSREMVLLR